MKKLSLSLALLFSGGIVESYAALPIDASAGASYVPAFCGAFTLGLSGIIWRPAIPLLDYTLNYRDTDDLINGHYHSVNPEYDWEYRFNFGYVFPCGGNDVNLSWTGFDHSDIDSVNNPGFLFPSLTSNFNSLSSLATAGFPPFDLGGISIPDILVLGVIDDTTVSGTLETPDFSVPITVADVDLAAARANFRNYALDLEFGQSLHATRNFHLRWFAGLRFAKVVSNLDAVYAAVDVADTATIVATVPVAGGAETGTVHVTLEFNLLANIRETVNQKSDFEGIGPRFGVDANYHLGCGFGIVGSIATSLLIGDIESNLFVRLTDTTTATLTDISTTSIAGPVDPIVLVIGGAQLQEGFSLSDSDAAVLAFKHPYETRIVPNIDAKIGIDYTYLFPYPSHSKVVMEAGWMVSHYFNSVDRLSQVGGLMPEFRTRHTSDVSFDGFYFGVQFAISPRA